jgi:hypothetical protein
MRTLQRLIRFRPANFVVLVFLLLAGVGSSLAQTMTCKAVIRDGHLEVEITSLPTDVSEALLMFDEECTKTGDAPLSNFSLNIQANVPIQGGTLFVSSAAAPNGANQFPGKNETKNTVVFQGVPLDSQAQDGRTRIIRITNVRVRPNGRCAPNEPIRVTVTSPDLQIANPTFTLRFDPSFASSWNKQGKCPPTSSFPRGEVFVGGEYFRDRESRENFVGSDASIAVNVNGHLGLVVDVPYLKSIGEPHLDSTLVPILAGAQFNYRREPFTLFGQTLLGGVHSSNTFTFGGTTLTTTSNAFGMKAGGGFDWYFAPHVGLRNQVDYDMTRFGGSTQNSYSYSGGMVFRFGGGREPAPSAGTNQGTPGARPEISQDSAFNQSYVKQLRESARFWREQAEKAQQWAREATDPKTREQWEREAKWDESNARQREELADHAEGKK